MKKYTVFDNGGESLDRYTVIDKEGDMLGLSETGAGFNQWCGNCVDNYMYVTFGYGWRSQCDVPRVIKHTLPEVIASFKTHGNLGKEIPFKSLSKELQKEIIRRYTTDES